MVCTLGLVITVLNLDFIGGLNFDAVVIFYFSFVGIVYSCRHFWSHPASCRDERFKDHCCHQQGP